MEKREGFKFELLDKQESNEWFSKVELNQLQDLLYEVVERNKKKFPQLGGHPYGWTTEDELKDIGKRIKQILMKHKDFFAGGIAHYNIDTENTFMLSVVFVAKHEKRKVKREVHHMVCITINENRKFKVYKAY